MSLMGNVVAVIDVGVFVWTSWGLFRTFSERKYNKAYCTNELHAATDAFAKWIEEGRFRQYRKLRMRSNVSRHLVMLTKGDLKTLELLGGTHGYTVYKTLLARQRFWRRDSLFGL